MCGIIGFTGNIDAKEVLLQGLKSLEYRGYDSAGISFFTENGVNTIKSVGKVDGLADKVASVAADVVTKCGIGHTRWATHGGVSEVNCHPHHYGRVTLIHNGIIENYKELQEELAADGKEPVSQTDSEIAAMVIDSCYKNNPIKAIKKAVKKFTGKIMQQPPSFSAIHIDGKRASDLARSGKTTEIPFRPVQVFSAEIQEILLDSSVKNDEKRVLACCIEFSVSKGTYIRSLARDIAIECGSAGHLVGLLRTKVGNFRLEDAAGFSELEEFNIENAFISAEKTKKLEQIAQENKKNNIHIKKEPDSAELELESQCVKKSVPMIKELASLCGFGCLTLAEGKNVLFENGAKLQSNMFTTSPFEVKEKIAAVFTPSEDFKGLLEKNEQGYFSYSFVVH